MGHHKRVILFALVALLGVSLFGWYGLTGHDAAKRIFTESDAIAAVAFSPDGSRIASGGSAREVRVWEAATGQLLQVLREDSMPSVSGVVFCGNGMHIVACAGRRLYMWDLKTPEIAHMLGDHADWIEDIGVSADGCRVISGGRDGTMRVWDLAQSREIARFEEPRISYHSVALSPDGREAVGGDGGHLVLWDVGSGKALKRFESDSWINAVAFSPDGRRLLSGEQSGIATVWDIATGNRVGKFRGHTWVVSSVAFCPDGQRAISGGWDNLVRVWEVTTGRQLAVLKGHKYFVNCVAVSPDGQCALSGSNDHTVRLWELPPGSKTRPSAASKAVGTPCSQSSQQAGGNGKDCHVRIGLDE